MDTSLKTLVSPEKTAVIVVDKQYGYFRRKGSPTTQLMDALPKIDAFVKEARSADIKIIWTKMLENPEDSPENIRFIMATGDPLYTTLTRRNDRSYDIIGEAQPTENELVIEKLYYNAFAHTSLAEHLKQNQITTLVFVGGYASRCVLATVTSALDNGFYPVVVQDLVANTDDTSEEVPVALRIIETIYGRVHTEAEVVDAWSD